MSVQNLRPYNKIYSSKIMFLSHTIILIIYFLLIMIIGETTFEHYSHNNSLKEIVRSQSQRSKETNSEYTQHKTGDSLKTSYLYLIRLFLFRKHCLRWWCFISARLYNQLSRQCFGSKMIDIISSVIMWINEKNIRK